MADTDLVFKLIAQDEAKQKLEEARAAFEKMTDAEKESVKASIEATEADRKLADSKQEVIDKVERLGERLSSIGEKMTIGVTLPLVGIATAATKLASDLSETRNKIDVLFGESSRDIQAWASTAATSLGQTQKQALDAASTFAVFGKSAGLAGSDLTKFSEQSVQLASDMASFFNTSPEDAIQAIGAAFRGEQEPIRRYGVLIDDASLKQEAMKLGLISTTKDALQPQQRVLAAQALILQQTGAAQGDFARTSDGLANSSRIVKAQLEDTLATLGEKFLPLALKGVQAVSGLLEAFQKLPPPMQDAIVAFGALAAAAGPVLTVGGKLISTYADLADKIPTLTGKLSDFSTVLKGIEFGVIIAGLIAIAKYLEEVGNAAKSTNDKLIEMSHSGDIFEQAAASTEIMVHGQERIKKTLDDVNVKLQDGKRTYEDYRSSIEATAKAAGYQIDAYGNLIKVTYGSMGATYQLVEANYALSRAVYEATPGVSGLDKVWSGLIDTGKQFIGIIAPQSAVLADVSEGIDTTAARYEAMGKSIEKANDLSARSIDVLKIAMSGAVTKELDSFNSKQDELKNKASELQRVISTSYGRARDDAVKSLGEINKQLDANVAAHEEATKRILFDIAAQQLATIADPQIRAKAMNELALQWGLVDKATYDATTKIIGYTDQLAKDSNVDAFVSKLKGVGDEILATARKSDDAKAQIAARDKATQERDTGASERAAKGITDTGAVAKKSSDDLSSTAKSAVETLGTQAAQQTDKVRTTGGNILQSFKDTSVNIMALVTNAANTATKDMDSLNAAIVRAEGVHVVEFKVKVTGDEVPSGGGGGRTDNIPERQHGGPVYQEGLYRLHADEYVLSAGMRYGNQTIPQQAIPAAQMRGGDTTIMTNNFYDGAATKLWLEKQRLDRVQSVLEAM